MESPSSFPPKQRVWDKAFRTKSAWYWNKHDFLPHKPEHRLWEPESPPKMPTNNPWVDLLTRNPDAPEVTQTCYPSKWVYGRTVNPSRPGNAKYQHGKPFVEKDRWFIILWRVYLWVNFSIFTWEQ